MTEHIKNELFGDNSLRVVNISIFPGSKDCVTKEQVVDQLKKSFDQLLHGDYEVIDEVK